jgi:hypothetical protein
VKQIFSTVFKLIVFNYEVRNCKTWLTHIMTSFTDCPKVLQDSTSTTVIHVKMSKNKLMLCAVSRQLTSHSTLVHRLFEADSVN